MCLYMQHTICVYLICNTNDSKLQAVDDLVNWSKINDMKINATKMVMS